MVNYLNRSNQCSDSFTSTKGELVVDFLLLTAGIIAHFLAYPYLDPIYFTFLVLLAGAILAYFFSDMYLTELRVFIRIFLAGFLSAGVAAYYSNVLDDPVQNYSDAAFFYELSSGRISNFGAKLLSEVTEGSGAVLIWSFFYDLATVFDFEIDRYVGIAINILVLSLVGVVAVKSTKLIYGHDYVRLKRLKLFFSCCGMVWLFQANHLRDGWVMLAVSFLIYYWTRFLTRPSLSDLPLLISTNLLGAYCLFYLREEFVFAPLAMLIAAVCAVLVSTEADSVKKQVAAISGILGLALFAVLLYMFSDTLLSKLGAGNEDYKQLSAEGASAQSLGATLVTNQILPIRLVVGSLYLFVFPIPVWIGFQLESSYHLFKSFNALFLYFVTPLFLLSVSQVINDFTLRKSSILFQLFVFLGFTLSTAGTSVESRHFATFFMPFFIFSLLPDLNSSSEWSLYLKYLSKYLFLMIVIHVIWSILKYFLII